MSLGLKGWAAVTAALCFAVLMVAASLSSSDRRADRAEEATKTEKAQRRVAEIDGATHASVGAATAAQADGQVRVERVTHTVIREIEANPDASTPIPADLARAWVSGLRRMCDEAGPGACAGPADRADADAGVEPVPAGDAPRGGRVDGGRGDDLRR